MWASQHAVREVTKSQTDDETGPSRPGATSVNREVNREPKLGNFNS